jgi:hypothetical protein
MVFTSELKTPCASTAVDGAARGIILGLVWGAVFPQASMEAMILSHEPTPPPLPPPKSFVEGAFRGIVILSIKCYKNYVHSCQVILFCFVLFCLQSKFKTKTPAGKSMIVCAGGFGMFLAIFSGITCACEQIRNKKDPANAFMGGVSAGAVVSLKSARSPQVIMTSALGTGALTGVVSFIHGGAFGGGSSSSFWK